MKKPAEVSQTEIYNNAPEQDRQPPPVTISLTEQQDRKIDFHKPCLDEFTIARRIDQGPWQVIASNVRLPYLDDDSFEAPIHLEYHITLKHQSGTSDDYFLKASLH